MFFVKKLLTNINNDAILPIVDRSSTRCIPARVHPEPNIHIDTE